MPLGNPHLVVRRKTSVRRSSRAGCRNRPGRSCPDLRTGTRPGRNLVPFARTCSTLAPTDERRLTSGADFTGLSFHEAASLRQIERASRTTVTSSLMNPCQSMSSLLSGRPKQARLGWIPRPAEAPGARARQPRMVARHLIADVPSHRFDGVVERRSIPRPFGFPLTVKGYSSLNCSY